MKLYYFNNKKDYEDNNQFTGRYVGHPLWNVGRRCCTSNDQLSRQYALKRGVRVVLGRRGLLLRGRPWT
jgi:hypothetical protein